MPQDFLRKGNKWSILLHRAVQNFNIRHIRAEASQALNCKLWMWVGIVLTDGIFLLMSVLQLSLFNGLLTKEDNILKCLVRLHVFYIFEFTGTLFYRLLGANTVNMPKKNPNLQWPNSLCSETVIWKCPRSTSYFKRTLVLSELCLFSYCTSLSLSLHSIFKQTPSLAPVRLHLLTWKPTPINPSITLFPVNFQSFPVECDDCY